MTVRGILPATSPVLKAGAMQRFSDVGRLRVAQDGVLRTLVRPPRPWAGCPSRAGGFETPACHALVGMRRVVWVVKMSSVVA